MARVGLSMKKPLDYRRIDPNDYSGVDPKPIQAEENPLIAAAIVFTPIVGAVVLLILYVLSHR
jgi:hypothetical protein